MPWRFLGEVQHCNDVCSLTCARIAVLNVPSVSLNQHGQHVGKKHRLNIDNTTLADGLA